MSHDALRPLIAQPSSTPAQVLSLAQDVTARVEAALPAWSAAVEDFATRVAPQLEDCIEAHNSI